MGPDDWLAQLHALLPAPATPLPPDALQLGVGEREALLDLARVAAHTSERWTAPLSTFLVGVAYATRPPEERAVAIRALVEILEPDA